MGKSRCRGLLILGIILVLVDQAVKIAVKTNMTYGQSFNVIGQWFRICFIENKGMAFGMSFGGVAGKYVLTVFRILLSGVLIWWIGRLAKQPDTPKGVLVGLTMITAGALGNVVDCLFYGQLFSESSWNAVATFGGSYAPFLQGRVVDMLYFPIIDTTWPSWLPVIGGKPFTFFDPVFNIADSCVTVGAFYLVLFQWKFFSGK